MTSTSDCPDQIQPYQSPLVKMLNLAATVLPIGRLSGLSRERLLRDADRKLSGLPVSVSDLLAESTELNTAFGQILEDLQNAPRLHPFGRIYIRQVLLGILINRAQLAALWQREPTILQTSLTAPLVILGLPRTGTSLLFELLARDPAHRYLSNWEATVSQVPAKGCYPRSKDPRRRAARFLLGFQKHLAPEMEDIHSFHLDGPEECTPLLMQSLCTFAIAAMFDLPAYDRWLDAADHGPTYRHFKKILQTLQWQHPGQRWLLKSPSHIEAVGDLLGVFPDAGLIQTHRDPARVVASFASLSAAFRGIHSSPLDRAALGQQILRRLSHDFRRYLKQREVAPPARFIDIHYRDLVADPMTCVDKIYAHFGLQLGSEARRAMEAYLALPRSGGGHRYSPADFGLNAEQIRAQFREYIDVFDIPLEA